MTDLREQLDAAVTPAREVRIDAQAAWADGVRRRVRRRVRVGAIGVVAVAAVAVAVPVARDLDVAPHVVGEPGAAAKHYPQRLDHDYVERSMPAVTGPLAGVIERNDEDLHGYYAVSPNGRMWRIDDAQAMPVPSPDGTRIAYMAGPKYDKVGYVMRDLQTGEVTEFPEIGNGTLVDDIPTTEASFYHQDQTPVFWNVASTALLMQVTRAGPRDGIAAGVLSVDGTVHTIPNSNDLPDGSHPVGWFDDSTAAFIAPASERARVAAVDTTSGRVIRSFLLDKADPEFVSQWYASLSPDGTTVVTLDDNGEPDPEPVRFYSAHGETAGKRRGTMPTPDGHSSACQPTWTSEDLYLPRYQSDERDAVLARVNGGTPIVADPRLKVTCSVWAASALEGGPDPSIGGTLFGTDSSWLSWHWREVSSGVLVGLALLVLGISARRRRRR
ncbi:hypothetical protein [Nocardioides sp.]|uniref:hypothetical protein n=1 Tax=Nocardioides sp. TaxID=35761 RepID=UPI002CF360A6|nr:hypothetical protein [Nocardioides sp.]HSX68944.1 hypothetical protein [Nocardioides sp.]